MAHGDFVWCDLSTRRLDTARRFYGGLLRWQFQGAAGPGDGDYLMAYTRETVAGLYTMPVKFADMGMPCFWMSYIEVDCARTASDIAHKRGGTVEAGPTDGGDGTTWALIRDPLGAGFTVLEGNTPPPRPDAPEHGAMAWNELYVSQSEAVIPFYAAIFGWTMTQNAMTGACDIAVDGRVCSAIHQLPDSLRGKEQFWGVHFAVDDRAAAKACIVDHGTIVDAWDGLVLARDPDGAAFFLRAVGAD